MSQDSKSFVRPKVRFSEDDGKKLLEEKTASNANKPKITSVVNINKPIKIVRPDSGARIQNVHHREDATETVQLRQNAVFKKTCQEPTIPHLIEVDNKTALSNANNVRKQNSSKQETTKSLHNNLRQHKVHVPSLIPPEIQDKELQKASGPLKSPTFTKKATSQNNNADIKNNTKYKVQRGKENKGPNKEKALLPERVQRVNSKSCTKGKISSILSTNASCSSVRSMKEPKPSGVIKPVSRNQNKKTVNTVMPCHKYKKVVSKVKVSPVKKLIVRDITGKHIKPCVGPGVIHEKAIPEAVKLKPVQSSISSEKLSRPEYNSIMCTINKLNDIKKERVVLDIDHLPSTYKDLINRKISTTLDFPFEESVFRNLVDLTIDEKQFTGRVMRSKDPEPRQKDIAPKLSDFFMPESLEEYCMPVSVKPRVPEMQNNWNAFRIHEKLSQWKESMDNED